MTIHERELREKCSDELKYLETALGGNMNTKTLTSLTFAEIMHDYLKSNASHILSRVEEFHPDAALEEVREWATSKGVEI